MFVSYAHGADGGFASCGFGFGKISWSTTSFCGNYNPTIKYVVFSEFIVGQINSTENKKVAGEF